MIFVAFLSLGLLEVEVYLVDLGMFNVPSSRRQPALGEACYNQVKLSVVSVAG